LTKHFHQTWRKTEVKYIVLYLTGFVNYYRLVYNVHVFMATLTI